MRKAYTMIEVIVVVAIVSILAVGIVTSYQDSQVDLVYHDEVAKIQSIMNNVRSAALSDSNADSEASYVINFHIGYGEEDNVRGYINTVGNEWEFDEGDTLVGELPIELGINDDIIDISEFRLLRDGTSSWGTYDNEQDLAFVFTPPFADCDFYVNGSADPGDLMVQVPISKSLEDNPLRYIYFHKKSCVPEVLIDDLTSY